MGFITPQIVCAHASGYWFGEGAHCTQSSFLFNTHVRVFSQAYQLNLSKTQLLIILQPSNLFISLPGKWHHHLANCFHSVPT